MSVVRWSDLTQSGVASLRRRKPVVLVPLGAMEQHGRHLPLGTDTFLAEHVCLEAGRLTEVEVIVTPSLWLGLSGHHMEFAGTLTLSARTWIDVVDELCTSLVEQGLERILLVNGHGGNVAAANTAVLEVGRALHGRARLGAVTYFHLLRERQSEVRTSRPGGTGHAGEFETSLMLALRPDLVDMTAATACYPVGASGHVRYDLFDTSQLTSYQSFRSLSESGTLGDPTISTEEAGHRAFRIAAEALAEVIKEVASWDLE